MKTYSPFYFCAVAVAGITTSYGVLNFVDNTWSGDGTVNSVSPGMNSPTSGGTRVTGITSGTLSIPSSSLLQNRFQLPTSVTLDYTVNGGTADIGLANRTNFDGGANRFDGITIGNFSGSVSSFSFTITYSNPVAARTAFTAGRLDSGPLGAALGLLTDASITGNFNTTLSYGGVLTAPDDLTAPTAGLPAGLANTSSSFTADSSNVVFTNTTGFTGIINDNLDFDFLIVDGWDGPDAGTNRNDADAALTYITSQTYTITSDTDFAGASFTTSLDGQQFANLLIVPEPSGVVLTSLALMMSAFRRRR